jgi:hypothetical protein
MTMPAVRNVCRMCGGMTVVTVGRAVAMRVVNCVMRGRSVRSRRTRMRGGMMPAIATVAGRRP